MKIKTFIINLISSENRKKYMEELLSPYGFLDKCFIPAVDGRILLELDKELLFDIELSYGRYGRCINDGEVGCTLSHFKCYNMLMQLGIPYVLIFEDDISIIRDLDKLEWSQIDSFMSVDEPRILFLSGDYWFWDNKPITRVCRAVGSYAYFINRSAAKIITNVKRPSNVADDWDVYKGLGVRLYAIHPYVIDANLADIPSEIKQDYWGNHKDKMSFRYVLKACYNGVIKRFLLKRGKFESKVRSE